MHEPVARKPALVPLTSFRFFAAIAVVLCHRSRVNSDDWLPYEWHGASGVTFFFLLSGFILAYTYHDPFVTRRPHATRDFLIARLARIMPAYVLAFVVALVALVALRGIATLHTFKYSPRPWQALAHLTLTQSWVPDSRYYFGFNSPAWSLSCEWFFYLTFPLLLLGLATGSFLRRVAVFAVFSATWAAVFGLYLSGSVDPAKDGPKWMWLGYVLPLTRVFDFACGVALGVLFVRLRPEVGPARGYRYWVWGVIELAALAALWATLHFCPVRFEGGSVVFPLLMLTGSGYYLPAFALLVWVGSLGRGPLSRVVSWSPLVYLGELSYGIYIFHFPMIGFVPAQLVAWGMSLHVHLALVLSCAITVVISSLSYHFWETPIRRLVRGRPNPPAALPLPAPAAVPERRAA